MNSESKKRISFFLLAGLGIHLAGCATPNKENLAQVLSDHPEILVKAIEANPSKFAMVFHKISAIAKEEMSKFRMEQEKTAKENAIENPLKPDLYPGKVFLGKEDAPLVLVTYSDFECPFCARGAQTVHDMLSKYKNQIKFVFKHMPLPIHPNARPAAAYFEAIALQDSKKAFRFHDELFKNQSGLKTGEPFLKKIAKKLGADMARLERDLKSETVAKNIDADMEEAKKFNLMGTPSFILNGVPLRGALPISEFDSTIDLLKRKGKLKI